MVRGFPSQSRSKNEEDPPTTLGGSPFPLQISKPPG